MSDAKKCDRCGAFYQRFKAPLVGAYKVEPTNKLDLCPECIDFLKKWLLEYEQKEEAADDK